MASCQTICLQDAVIFSDKEYIRGLIKERGILTKVKKELNEKINSENKPDVGVEDE